MTLVSTTITGERGRGVDKLSRRQVEIDSAERRKAPADRLGQVRLRLIAAAAHSLPQDRSRFGFDRSGMPRRPHALFNNCTDLAYPYGPPCGVFFITAELFL